MLFITNRTFKQGKKSPQPGKSRKVDFDLRDNGVCASVYYCTRSGKGKYREIGSETFQEELKNAPEKQILLYVHGFNNMPEKHIFPRAEALQALCDEAEPGLIKVVPLIWPCDDDLGVIKDYWDDQDAADMSAFSFVRVLGKFMTWRSGQGLEKDACFKRINILTHSMGNRVLRLTMDRWDTYNSSMPQMFRNVFMVAADVVNETLERNNSGFNITKSGRNICIYFASDDLALRASKAANLKNKTVSRRLGHTGPEDMEAVPNNVYAIDCDNFNNTYDKPTGHSYFLRDHKGAAGSVFKHMFHAMKTGRVDVREVGSRTLELPRTGYLPPSGSRE